MSFAATLFSRISPKWMLISALIGLLSISGAPITSNQGIRVPAHIEANVPEFRRRRFTLLQIWQESKLRIDFSGQIAFKNTEFLILKRLFKNLHFQILQPSHFLIIPSLGRAGVQTA